jgi:translation initiation factor IF-2
MSIRVHDLAKRCGLSNKEMLEKLHSMNYPVKTHSSTVDNITAEAIEQEYGYVPPAPVAEPIAPAAPVEKPEPQPVTERAAEAPTATAVIEPPEVATPKPVAPPPPAPSEKIIVPAALPKQAAAASPIPATPKVTAVPAPPVKPAAPKISAPPPSKVVIPAPQAKTPVATPAAPAFVVDEQGHKVIQMKPPVVVRDLAGRMGVKPHLLLSELMQMNVFANLNEAIGEDIARKICERHGFVFELEKRAKGEGVVHAPPKKKPEPTDVEDKPDELTLRPPVVTFMGHVDHGKTSLLDAIRKTNVAGGESGGITQHIGASVITTGDGKQIVFLDTPGHEAFTKMRARGANVTDIVVLVVAADDGIMPQTLEALSHARAAQVPVIVAINKSDLPTANPDRVKKQLQEQGLSPESWGGDTIAVEVSATTKKGIDTLLEMILLQAEMMELKASPRRAAKGNVIEAQMEPGMGPTATVLVRKGTLRVGDALICGPHGGKIKALINDRGQRMNEAGPSFPAKVVGLWGLPDAGTEFTVVKNEKEARELSTQRELEARSNATAEPAPRTTLEDLLGQTREGRKKTLQLVIKADVQGSLEAISESLGKLDADKVELDLLHGAVGNINENDVLLASASDAVIIGFRVKAESGVTDIAKREGVQIKLYSIIYELIDQVEEAMEGLLEPEAKETIVGHAEVKKIFQLTKGPVIAGCVVTDGRIARSGRVRVLRHRAVQYDGRIASLKHFQDDVKEVKAGQECGLRLDNFPEFQEGDVLECYSVEKVAAKL